MIYEVAIQHVEAEKRDEYVKVFSDILLKTNFAGSHGIKFLTSVEDPTRVILIIEWDSVEAHTRHRGTPPHNAMREVTSTYQTKKSEGAHFIVHDIKPFVG